MKAMSTQAKVMKCSTRRPLPIGSTSSGTKGYRMIYKGTVSSTATKYTITTWAIRSPAFTTGASAWGGAFSMLAAVRTGSLNCCSIEDHLPTKVVHGLAQDLA